MQTYTPTPDFYNDYIAHFGILGQKWGKRNGPPYPLDSDKSTGKRLKKFGSTDKKYAKKDEKLKSIKTIGYGTPSAYDRLTEARDTYIQQNKKRIKDYSEELKTLNKSLDPKDPKTRNAFTKQADKEIKETLDMFNENPEYFEESTGKKSFSEKDAIKYAIEVNTYGEIRDGSKDKYVDWLINESNQLSKNDEYKKHLEKQINIDSENLKLLESSKEEPLSKFLESNGVDLNSIDSRMSGYDILSKILKHSDVQATYLGEIELTDETLVHYGVKGMKWGCS